MNKTQRRRTLTLTALFVTLMMLFLGGRAFGLLATPSHPGAATANETEWKRESEGQESAGSTSFAIRTSDSADRERADPTEGLRRGPSRSRP